MSFVKKITGPDEKLVGIARIHWIYGLQGLGWLIAFLLLGIAIDIGFERLFAGSNEYVTLAIFDLISFYALRICIGIGGIIFLFYFFALISTEIGLTTKRLIYKRGLIMVDVKEVDIEEIKGADVDNGFFGRLLNYGYIQLDARFVQNVNLPAISQPYRFVKALNEMRSRDRSDTMKVVLEGVGDQVRVVGQNNQQNSEQKSADKLHGLQDKRYETFSGNPATEAREIAKEAQEGMGNLPEGISSNGHKNGHKNGHVQPRQETKPKSKPIVFKQAILKQEIKENFAGTSDPG